MEEGNIKKDSEARVDQFPWGEVRWYVSGEQGNSAEMSLGKYILKTGATQPAHSHPNCEEIFSVLRGRIKHTVAGVDEMVEMGPGDTIVLPPDLPHTAENVGAEDAVAIIAYSSAHREVRDS